MQNMMLAYSSKCDSVIEVVWQNLVVIIIRNIQILDLPKYLVSMAMFVLHYLCIGRASKRGFD